jgi:Prealbumin-like fold domain
MFVVALVQAAPAFAADPNNVGLTLEGCKEPAIPASYNPPADLVCNSGDYTTGNLGKNWEELDLVPHRLTAEAKNAAPATQTYTVSVVADHEDVTRPGYDFISVPVVNASLSTAGACNISVGALQTGSLGGGIDLSMWREITFTNQPKNSTCVLDFVERLAVGSHLFPGAALHSNVADEDQGSIGAREVPLPVNEIQPQQLAKEMSATQDTDHVWNITKGATPDELNFSNTCDSTSLSADVTFTIEWERISVAGEVALVANIYATNPANRVITVNVEDKFYEGTTQTTQVGLTGNSGDVDVPANTANFLVMTHSTSTSSTASHFNDVAIATYKDKLTGVPVPGQTTATAGADVQSGSTTNATATITDVESISGDGFSYSVDSFSGASGSFSGYTAGTETTDPVTWVSGSQSGNGTVTFNKTVYVDGPRIGSGTLSDTATLNASDGFTNSASADVDLSADAEVALTINKTIPDVLEGSETDAFTFLVTGPGGFSQQYVLNFSAGDTSEFTTVTGLDPGSYTVKELSSASGNWAPQSDQVVNLNLPTCSGAATFNNTFTPAAARVSKVTVPAGTSSEWEFQLVRTDLNPDVVVDTETIAAGSGFHGLDGDLAEGTYEIRETGGPAGFDLTDVTGGTGVSVVGDVCTFTVDYVANAGDVFDCTFENTQEGRIEIEKQTQPAGSAATFDFTGEITATLSDNGVEGKAVDPGTYSVSEAAKAGWDLTSIVCNDANSTGAGSTATFNVEPGETVRCVFNNRQRGTIIVEKQTDPDGAAGSFSFTGDAAGTISDNGTIVVSNLTPGTYTSTEGDPTPNFDLTTISCDDGASATPSTVSVATRKATFKLDPGETVKCTFTNRQRGMAKVIKTVSGGPVTQAQGSGFVFQLRSGAVPQYPGGEGTILESGEANAGNGGVIAFTTKLVPGDTYQLCEIIMPGWLTSLVGFVPNSVGNPIVDNSPICVNFTVSAGETKEISVDNTPPPGGRALTIGFWKNWASCSGGKQRPVLDQTLASFPIASGQTTHGVYIGDLYVDTCLEAVRILNKSTINTGAKKASDPAFNLAAQLLAAKLNLQAGAGVCPAAITAINQAQLLLDQLNFNGITHGTISNALATQLNNLATTIDKYNNNILC